MTFYFDIIYMLWIEFRVNIGAFLNVLCYAYLVEVIQQHAKMCYKKTMEG